MTRSTDSDETRALADGLTAEETVALIKSEGAELIHRKLGSDWAGLDAVVARQEAFDATLKMNFHLVEFCIDGGSLGMNEVDGLATDAECTYRPNGLFFFPAHRDYRGALYEGSSKLLQLMIKDEVITDAKRAVLKGDADRIDLYGFNAAQDPKMGWIARTIHHELIRPSGGGAMMADTMALALCIEIVRGYADGQIVEDFTKPMRDDARIFRAIDYAEAHLGEEFSIAELAAVGCMSTWHFSRCFKSAVGEPPHRWLMRRRTERAIELITDTREPLAEIAHRCGFSSQSHMGAAVKSMTGATPATLRDG